MSQIGLFRMSNLGSSDVDDIVRELFKIMGHENALLAFVAMMRLERV